MRGTVPIAGPGALCPRYPAGPGLWPWPVECSPQSGNSRLNVRTVWPGEPGGPGEVQEDSRGNVGAKVPACGPQPAAVTGVGEPSCAPGFCYLRTMSLISFTELSSLLKS